MKLQFGHGEIDIPVSKMVNAGYAGCDQKSVKEHIDELAAIGVPVPKTVPTFYPIPITQLMTCDKIQVCNGQTSAEVEYVIFLTGGKAYITVGSDHSDRALEVYSVHAAKQICPNIVAREVWDYDSVKDHLDQVHLTCEVYDKGEWRVYQSGAVTSLLSPEELLKLGRDAIGNATEGLVLYSGTIPTIGEITYAGKWKVQMEDKVLGKVISTQYEALELPGAIE